MVPDEALGGFNGLFSAFSLLAGVAFNYGLMGCGEAHYTALFLGVALLMDWGSRASVGR